LDKLLTEDSVRQLMRQNKLANQDQLTLPRGTILTPAARSFLGEHQIKIKQTNATSAQMKVQAKEAAKPNRWLESANVVIPPVDFNQLSRLGTPLIRLQSTLRQQVLLLLTLLSEQSEEIDQSVVTELVEFVNSLLTKTFDQILTNEDCATDQLKLTSMKLVQPKMLVVQQLQSSVGDVAAVLGDYVRVQPELQQSAYYKAIVQWQMMIQTWTQTILESR